MTSGGYLEVQHRVASDLVGALDATELQILVAMVRGMSLNDTAAVTGLAIEKVARSGISMMKKLGATRTADAVRIGLLARIDVTN